MKKSLALLVLLVGIALAGAPGAADISSLAWNQSNIATLRSLDKADLVNLLNELWPGSFATREIGQHAFADLTGTGQYCLVLTLSGPCAHFVGIYSRDASGRLNIAQRLTGFANLKTAIRDLNDDGRDELIIDKPLVEYNCAAVTTWPAVYRLQHGNYVESSPDFPSFYDNEVLPKLNAEIREYTAKAANAKIKGQWSPAGLITARDKILRVLGRDPTAGLHQAYQWMNSGDPYLALDAEATFKDIGGHQQEASAAQLSYKRAICKRHPRLVMCKGIAKQ
jgi:hypothetical protein